MPEVTITSPYVHSRVDSIYHGQPCAQSRPSPESTLSPSQGLWIWPLDILDILIVFHKTFAIIGPESRFPLFKNRPEWRIRPDPDPKVWVTTVPTPQH
jgi:hypothetical protein